MSHASVCAKVSFMLKKSSIWITLSFEIPDFLYWIRIFRKIFVMNYHPMTSLLVVRYSLFHSINKRSFILLFCWLFLIETLVGPYVGWVKEVVYFFYFTIVKIVYFMKPIHSLLCKSSVWVHSVFWNSNIRCKLK